MPCLEHGITRKASCPSRRGKLCSSWLDCRPAVYQEISDAQGFVRGFAATLARDVHQAPERIEILTPNLFFIALTPTLNSSSSSSRTFSVLYLRKCHDKTAPHAVHVGQKTALSFARKADTCASFRRLCGRGKDGWSHPSRINHTHFKRCPKLQSQVFMAVPVPKGGRVGKHRN